MPYVPGCRHDLFISYANDNNREGWVEQFDKRKLQVAQSYSNELASAARESAILLPILSAWLFNFAFVRPRTNGIFL